MEKWKATDYVMVDGKRRYDVETDTEVIAMDVEQANAERIVKAVNCHDDLVEALKKTKEWLSRFGEHSPISFGGEMELDEILRQALAKAE